MNVHIIIYYDDVHKVYVEHHSFFIMIMGHVMLVERHKAEKSDYYYRFHSKIYNPDHSLENKN